MTDANKNEIPVLMMTNLPTVEKEKKALDPDAETSYFTCNSGNLSLVSGWSEWVHQYVNHFTHASFHILQQTGLNANISSSSVYRYNNFGFSISYTFPKKLIND